MPKKRQSRSRDADDVIRTYIEADVDRPGVKETFQDSQQIPGDRREGRTREQAALTGGDVDAARNQTDAGEEVVGGDNPTPDQDIVDNIGKSAGVTYEDQQPLQFDEKLERRDRDRWELNPVSSEDYQLRQEQEREIQSRKAPSRRGADGGKNDKNEKKIRRAG